MNKCQSCKNQTKNKRFCNLDCCYKWQRKFGWFKQGIKLSKVSKQKISNSVPRGDKHPSKKRKWRENLSRKLKGKPKTLEHKLHISKARKGIKFTKKHKRNLSIANTGMKKPELSARRIGSGNPAWLGGISFEPYSIDWKEKLKKSIRKRDNYICQLCNQYGNSVHHIDYNKKNCNLDNLITLCRSCNSKVNKNRDNWTNYFRS